MDLVTLNRSRPEVLKWAIRWVSRTNCPYSFVFGVLPNGGSIREWDQYAGFLLPNWKYWLLGNFTVVLGPIW